MGITDKFEKAKTNASSASNKFIKASREYYTLKIFQQLTQSMSYAAKIALIGSLVFIGVVLLFVAGVIYFGAILDSVALACVLMACLSFILGLIMYSQRKKIDKMIIRKIAHEFFD